MPDESPCKESFLHHAIWAYIHDHVVRQLRMSQLVAQEINEFALCNCLLHETMPHEMMFVSLKCSSGRWSRTSSAAWCL